MLRFEKLDNLFEETYDINESDHRICKLICHANESTPLSMVDFQSFSYEEAVHALEQVYYYTTDEAETYYISDGEVEMYNSCNLLYEVNRNGHLRLVISELKSSKAKKFL